MGCGNLDFISFCTAINFAQVGWNEFQKKIRFAEYRYGQMLDSTNQDILDNKDHQTWLKVIITYFLDPVRQCFNVLWGLNYALSIICFLIGMVLLYFEISGIYAYLLLYLRLFI
jgi:hypothetical protein